MQSATPAPVESIKVFVHGPPPGRATTIEGTAAGNAAAGGFSADVFQSKPSAARSRRRERKSQICRSGLIEATASLLPDGEKSSQWINCVRGLSRTASSSNV